MSRPHTPLAVRIRSTVGNVDLFAAVAALASLMSLILSDVAGLDVAGPGGAVALLIVLVATSVTVLAALARFAACLAESWTAGDLMVTRAASRVLPVRVGTRYAEEWAGELYDLRAEGARWWRRAGYVAGILCWPLPALVVTLRLDNARAVD